MTALLVLAARLNRAMLASATDPSWGDLAQLGVIALAMIVGYVGCYRLQVLHERTRTAAAEERAEKERARTEESESRERKLAEAALPALQEANRALLEVGKMLERQSRP